MEIIEDELNPDEVLLIEDKNTWHDFIPQEEFLKLYFTNLSIYPIT